LRAMLFNFYLSSSDRPQADSCSKGITMSKPAIAVTRFSESDNRVLSMLLDRYGLVLKVVDPGMEIRGSFWGDEEAGLVGNCLVVRGDTPLHSVLHEVCHYICMDKTRRGNLDTDAGGDYDEENAVCYLQLVLADKIPGFGREQMFSDMDAWGYTFRLGSARAWFEKDADDARSWLLSAGIISASGELAFKLRS
jgi:hypothetical protein